MVCDGLNATINEGISGILAYPTTCDYYFYSKIMAAIWIILTMILYFNEKEKDNIPKPDMISCLGISSLATIFIALAGSLLGIIQTDVFIEIFVMGMIFVAIWLFKR